jgi:hypothetical protein
MTAATSLALGWQSLAVSRFSDLSAKVVTNAGS